MKKCDFGVGECVNKNNNPNKIVKWTQDGNWEKCISSELTFKVKEKKMF